MKTAITLQDLHTRAAQIASDPATPRARAEYARAYAGVICTVVAALAHNDDAPEPPPWTEGRFGRESYDGMMDAIADCITIGIPCLFVTYGAVSASSGAHDASDPRRWAGYPAEILRGGTPWRESRTDGYRPTEANIAADTAVWVSVDPVRRAQARPAIRGHYGQCAYCTLWIAP